MRAFGFEAWGPARSRARELVQSVDRDAHERKYFSQSRPLDALPDDLSPHARYTYEFHEEGRRPSSDESEAKRAEDMRYIQETILTLTGGCEVCQHSVGPFCKKHKHPIQPGDPRCDDFARRFRVDPEGASRAQVRQYVNDALGITDGRTVGRLMGES